MTDVSPAGSQRDAFADRHALELSVLQRVGALCAAAGNSDAILAGTTRLVADVLHSDRCGFLLLDRDRAVLVPHQSFVLTDPGAETEVLPLSFGIPEKTVRTGQPWRVADVRLDPDYRSVDARTRSALCLPLSLRGKIGGVLNIEHSQLDAFTAADERLLLSVLPIVGAALDRLYAQEPSLAIANGYCQRMENLPMGVIIHDLERVYYANQKAMQLIGVSSHEQLCQLSPLEIVAPADRERLLQRIQTTLQTKEQLPSIEVQICRPAGATVTVEMNSLWTEYAGHACVQAHFSEVTARSQAERSQAENDLRFRKLADAIPQIVWIAGADGGLTHLNAKTTEYFGVGVDDLTGWSWDKVVYPEDLAATVATWKKCLEDGLPRDLSFRIRRADGAFRWHIVRQVPIRDASGAIIYWYGTCTDIEDLKQAEKSLQENESRFRLLFEGAADAILWADADTGLIIHCNRAAELMLGRERNEIIGQHQSFLHPPEEVERYRKLFEDHATQRSTDSMEVEVLHRDGSRIDVAISPSVTAIGGQRVIQGFFRNISDRKRNERTIQKLSTFREAIIRTAAEGICVCAPVADFPFVFFSVWNDRMTEITGYSIEEINRLGWYQTLYPDPEVRLQAQQRMDRMRLGDDLHAEEWEITCKNGERRAVLISTSIVELNEHSSAVAALIQDVTIQKQAIRSLKYSERSLQFFRSLVNLTNDSIFVIEPSTSQFLDVNERACEELGYSRAELLELGVIDITRRLEDQISWQQRVLAVKAAGSMLLESAHCRKDGSTFPVEINVRYVSIDQQDYMVAVARDITERRQADAARQAVVDELRRSEERFSKLFHASPFSIIVASYPTGKIIEANDAFLRIFEFQREEVIGRTTSELNIWVLPGDRQRMLDTVRSQGAARNMEYQFRTKSGSHVVLVMSVEIIRLDGQDYSLAMSIDISARKRMEVIQRHILEAIAPTSGEDFFQALTNHLASACQVDYAFVGAVVQDRRAVQTLAVSHRGVSIGNFRYPLANSPCELLLTQKMCRYPKAVLHAFPQVPLLAEMGIEGYLGISLTSITGQVVGFLVLLHRGELLDWQQPETLLQVVASQAAAELQRSRAETARRDAIRSLQESVTFLRMAQEAAHVGSWEWDLQTQRFKWSAELARMYGLRLEEFDGTLEAALSFCDPESAGHFRQFLMELCAGRNVEGVECRIHHRNGSICDMWFVGQFRPGDTQRSNQVLGVAIDITDRKQSEEQRRVLASQLAQAQKLEAIGRLAGGVAHDFNNILTVINGYSKMLQKMTPPEDPQSEMLHEIVEAGARAATLTQQLLNYSRKQVINRLPLDLNEVVREMDKMLGQLIGENIRLEIAYHQQPAMVTADSGQLGQVVMNLVVNARDAARRDPEAVH